MKILQILYSLASGGAERFVVDLSNEMADGGHEVIICALRDDKVGNNGFYKPEITNKVEYINLRLVEGFRISNIFVLFKIIKQFKPDIVHCHQNLVNYIFPISILFQNIKFIHTIHTDPPNEVKSKLEYYLRKYFYMSKKINAITISNETSNSFIKYYKTNNFTEIYNGRKSPSPSCGIKQVTLLIDDLRKTNDTILLHVARCAPVKNQKMLIKVINRIINEGKSIALLIIGDGFDSEVGFELKSIANKKIIFLGQKHNIADYYLNTDGFCLSSIHEGMPITLIEALSCGCTPICTPVGGIIDTIENGVTGFLAKSISEEEYYQALTTFLNKKEQIKRGDLVRLYNEKFNIVNCRDKHIALYRKN